MSNSTSAVAVDCGSSVCVSCSNRYCPSSAHCSAGGNQCCSSTNHDYCGFFMTYLDGSLATGYLMRESLGLLGASAGHNTPQVTATAGVIT